MEKDVKQVHRECGEVQMTTTIIIACLCSGIVFGAALIICAVLLKKIYSKLDENERCCETKAWQIECADRVYRRYEQMQLEFQEWRHLGFQYGWYSPNDMRKLIDSLVVKINKECVK